MTDDAATTGDTGLSRLDALELAVIQLADALEVVVSNSAGGLHGNVDDVLAQIQQARGLVGERDQPDPSG